jgi:hypothetical protein
MGRGSREPTCWDCGAPNTPGSSECWLCQRRDWNRYPGVRWPPPPPQRSPLATIAGLMVGIAIIGLAIAVFREAPGIGIVLVISLIPALLITTVKARRRRQRGEPMSTGEKLFRVVLLTVLLPILFIVALGIAVGTICLFLSLR